MAAAQECQENPVKTIKSMVFEIIECLNSKTKELKHALAMRKQNILRESNSLNEERSQMLRKLEKVRKDCDMLIARRGTLQQALEQDTKEMSRLEAENKQLELQLGELQEANTFFQTHRADLLTKQKQLEMQFTLLASKYEQQAALILSENQNYRVYLGIDIQRLKNSHLKVVFYGIGLDCHVILDLQGEPSIVECVPLIEADKLNYILKEGDFYEFIKMLRKEFQKRLK